MASSIKKAPPNTKRLVGWKAWSVRLALLVGSPLLFLLLVEGGLALFGYSTPTAFFVPHHWTGGVVHVSNQKFCHQFVPEHLARAPEFIELAPKQDDVLRVFVLGGSAAAGDPAPEFGFSRVLEVLLNAPALYEMADGILEVDRLEDPLLRKVGQRIWEAARCHGAGDSSFLSRLLSSTEDEAEARVLIELSSVGEHIGNWEETLHCALERIEQANARREHQSRAESLIRLERHTDDTENEPYRQPLEAIARGLNAMTKSAPGHCIPPKLRRRRDAAASPAGTLLEAGE